MEETQGDATPATPTEKIYCCGNSTKREATLIAKFDLVASFFLFCIFLSFLIVIASNPEYFTEMSRHASGNVTTDLHTFILWPRASQLAVISLYVVLHNIYIVLAILLWISAAKRYHKGLLIWFISTILSYSAGVALLIVTVIFLYDKLALSVYIVSLFLYKWYGLWIVKILMKEITSVEGEVYYGDDRMNAETRDDLDSIDPAIPLDKF